MKLLSFSVKNYRSITGTSKLLLRDTITTIIGPNNEGKSNVLHALVTALRIASKLDEYTITRQGRVQTRNSVDVYYNWDVDFPLALQSSTPNGTSEFDIELQLNADEVAEFRKDVASTLNGTLPIRITVGRDKLTFAVRKRGPGGPALSKKAIAIARFIGRRIDLQYIPAVRPASTAMDVVQRIVHWELAKLAQDDAYKNAAAQIENLQGPVLQSIGDSIRDTLRVFLPDVATVQVTLPRLAARGQSPLRALGRGATLRRFGVAL